MYPGSSNTSPRKRSLVPKQFSPGKVTPYGQVTGQESTNGSEAV